MKRQLLGLIAKDLRIFRADRRALVITIAVPAILALLFGAVFGRSGGSGKPKALHVETRVVDNDGSAGSARLVAALGASSVLGAQAVSEAVAVDLVKRGDIDVAIVIPKGFVADSARAAAAAASDDVGDGVAGAVQPGPALTLLTDPTAPMQTSIAQGEVQRVMLSALAPELGPDFERKASFKPPFSAVIKTLSGPDSPYDGASHSLAGLGIQFILIGAVDSAVLLLTERQRGLLRRVRAAPISRGVLIASRLVSGAVIALFVTLFLYAFGAVTMGISIKGSVAGFALVAVTFALMASALGVLISTLGKTPQATRGAGIFVILIATMLSGAWFPAFLFPDWLQSATLFVPSRWAVDGLDAMTWRGLGLSYALAPAGVMLLSAVVFAAIATWRFRWED